MRFEIRGENRLGITRDVINVLTDQGLDIRAFEVTTHHIYADIPAVRPERFRFGKGAQTNSRHL